MLTALLQLFATKLSTLFGFDKHLIYKTYVPLSQQPKSFAAAVMRLGFYSDKAVSIPLLSHKNFLFSSDFSISFFNDFTDCLKCHQPS